MNYWSYIMLALAVASSVVACEGSHAVQEKEAPRALSVYQRMALTYLTYPRFVHEDFNEQFFGLPIQAEKYQPSAERLFFSAPKSQVTRETLSQLVLDLDSITFAVRDSVGIFLDPYYFEDSSYWYFQFSTHQMRIDSTRLLSLKVGDVTYEASLTEIARVFSGEMMFNGPAIAQTHERNHRGQAYVVGNHCATIALQGEPSFQRLVSQVIDTSMSQELNVQALLDFVTRHISYTGDAGMEIFRRPTEVLLSQTADCSGKVVLFASLLSQMDYPYLLLYFKNHIALAVPGDFSDRNGMHFDHEGQRYYFAETTSRGFQIGKSYFQDPLSEDDIKYVQYPGKRTKLYDVKNKDSLSFVQR